MRFSEENEAVLSIKRTASPVLENSFSCPRDAVLFLTNPFGHGSSE